MQEPGSFLFPQLHIWRIGKFISAQDVDGWVVGLNERLGIMLAPAGAIFLVVFGHRFLGADQSRIAVVSGSISVQLSAAMLDRVWVPISTQ